MPECTTYTIDDVGRLDGVAFVATYRSDKDALMEAVKLLSDTAGIEVWESTRRICWLPPKGGHPNGGAHSS